MGRCLALGFLLAGLALPALAQEAPRVFNLKVVSDAVPDLTSVEALVASLVKPGMTDEEKCLAAWRAVYEHRFWHPDSRGAIHDCGTDPILVLNCFAPTICQQDSEMCVALWNAMGFSGRVYQLEGHTTSEVFYGGRWRVMDATSGPIVRDDKGEIVGIAEKHLWTGGKARLTEKSFIAHTDGFVLGHRMELALRPGESFRRYWAPLSKDADYWTPAADGKRPVDRKRGDKSSFLRTWDLRPRQFEPLPEDAAYANGVWVYEPAIAPGLAAAEESQGLEAVIEDGRAFLQPSKAAAEGWAVFRVRSPYVIAGGWLKASVRRGDDADTAKVLASTDGGKTWREIWSGKGKGVETVKAPLREAVSGSLDYRLKVVMRSASPGGVRVSGLRVETITQLNPFALPALKLGETQVTVAAGPQLDTISINPDLDLPSYRAQVEQEQNTCTARESNQAGWVHGLCAKEADKDSVVVFKVQAPGAIRRVRFGGQFLGGNDTNKLYYSLDGKAWTEKEFTYAQAPKVSANPRRSVIADYETVDSLPEGTRAVWVKFWFRRNGPIKDPYKLSLATALRVDADYVPVVGGTPAPVDVIYHYVERHGDRQVEKTHVQTIRQYPTTYKVTVAGDKEPFMRWVEVRLAGQGPASRLTDEKP